jgi:tRNA(Ile)-lysidine synthase
MQTFHRFEQLVAQSLPEDWCEVGLVAAVSGGADSVALLRAASQLNTSRPGRLAAAHFNHRLRGAESDADQQFVGGVCRQLGVELVVGHAELTPDGPAADGDEAVWRAQRYEFLRATAERLGARYVATAHTADDQVETVLHRILRGTGLRGLAGIRRVRSLSPAVTVIRPMLSASRSDVVAYLSNLSQPYREDGTNLDNRYTRNRIRHDLLPMLERDFSPTVRESLARLANLAGDAQRVTDALADELLARTLIDRGPWRLSFDRLLLAGADRHVVRQTLMLAWRRQDWPMQAMGFAEWDLLAQMVLDDESSRRHHTLPTAVRVVRTADRLTLERIVGP